MNIFVDNVSNFATAQNLKNLFSEFGKVYSIICLDTLRRKPIWIVNMPVAIDAQNAVTTLNNTFFMHKSIKVTIATLSK